MVLPLLALALVVSAAAPAAPASATLRHHPHVDLEAMDEAIAATNADDGYASAAAYAHFLASRMAHQKGDPLQAIAELRLALASDDGEPYLVTTLAEEYTRAHDLPRAHRLLTQLLRRHPRWVPALLLQGRVLYEQRKPQAAIAPLRQAIKLAPTQSAPYLLLAQIALEAKHPDRAVSTVKALWDRAGDTTGLKTLGGALAERGDLTRAQRLLQKATQVAPEDPEAWAALAQVEASLGNDARAEQDFSAALERDPDDREALLSAGRAALRLRSEDHARAYFDRLLSLDGAPDVELQIAFSYLAAHRKSEALRVLDEALLERDVDPKVAFYAGLVHERAGDLAQADQAFGKVPFDGALGRDALLHRAQALTHLGKRAQAEHLLSTASAQHPEDGGLVAALAAAVELGGHPLEAEKLLREALTARPSTLLYEALAELLQRNGGQAAAVELLTHASAQAPADGELAFALGEAYERQGDHDRALAQMRQVLVLDPANAEAMNFIGYSLAASGQGLEEAERLLQEALTLKPDSGAYLDSLGWLYFHKGDFARAAGTLEKAAALAPEEPVILGHLGDAYRKLDRRGLATAAYQRALEALKGAAGDPGTRGLQGELARKLKMLSTEASGR